MTNQGRPDAALICAAQEDEEPERCCDKAEDGHEHHPAQRVHRYDEGGRHQDPHQTSEDLRGSQGGRRWESEVGENTRWQGERNVAGAGMWPGPSSNGNRTHLWNVKGSIMFLSMCDKPKNTS